MSEVELLNWARGPGLNIATFIMLFGIVLRIFEILSLGNPKDLAEARASGAAEGWRTIFRRSVPEKRHWKRITAGYLYHIGLFVVIFLFVPHIQFFKETLGLFWPGVANDIVDFFTVLSIGALLYVLFSRITTPERRILSTKHDYLIWLVTFLPFLTGYMAYHRLIGDYTFMLAIHILSVELLMIILPFSKLSHAFSFIFARWYTGVRFGRRGIQA